MMHLTIIFTIKDTGIVTANEPCHVFLQSAECVDNMNTPNSWPLFSNNCCYIHITHTHPHTHSKKVYRLYSIRFWVFIY